MPDEAILAIKERAADMLMRIPGVTGVGIGGRERGGTPTGELVLKVFVAEKRPLDQLTPGETLPTQFEGIGIDVSVLGIGRLEVTPVGEQAPPGVLPGKPLNPENDLDATPRPALIGGCQVQSDMSGIGFGTLGCILLHKTNPALVYALTNYHVVVGKGPNRPDAHKGITRMGHPDGSGSCTKCCSNQFGTYVAGDKKTPARDAALIQLDAGTKYQKEVLGIGVLTGATTVPSDPPAPPPAATHTITLEEVKTQRYDVRKYGVRTRLTGGVVEAINTTHTGADQVTRTNVTVTRPNPSINVPLSEPLYFSNDGDSGSVLVNNLGQVVTLHYGGDFVSEPGKQRVNKSLSQPIEAILQTFAAEGIPVEIAVGTKLGVTYIVPGATTVALPQELVPALAGLPAGQTVQVPVEAPWLPGVPRPTPHLLADLQQQLNSTQAGRVLINLWLRNSHELVALLQEHRRVALVWHRCGGPGLMQMFFRMTGDHTLAMPQTINGRPLTEAFHRIADGFGQYASPGLRQDLAQAKAALPELAGMTFPRILIAFGPEEGR